MVDPRSWLGGETVVLSSRRKKKRWLVYIGDGSMDPKWLGDRGVSGGLETGRKHGWGNGGAWSDVSRHVLVVAPGASKVEDGTLVWEDGCNGEGMRIGRRRACRDGVVSEREEYNDGLGLERCWTDLKVVYNIQTRVILKGEMCPAM